MNQDYERLTLDQLELLEKQSMRTIVQAVQEYSREAREIFETTEAASENEIVVLGEDLVQYALEVAECYPINKRFAGFIDYKRVRWLSTPFGIFPQSLLVDAKASTENNRETLQRSQLPMDAEYTKKGGAVERMEAGFPPHLPVLAFGGTVLKAVTTSAFVHLYYQDGAHAPGRFRRLIAFYILLIPHKNLKPRYNPGPGQSFFGAGKHSPARNEDPRIRVYFDPLRRMCPWRVQELRYPDPAGPGYTAPRWRDRDAGLETNEPFDFIGR